jgi:phosphoribosylformylglycinamidine cyclo-ligase
MSAESYLDRGVSPTKEDVKKAIENAGKGIYPDAFCKILPDFFGDEKYCTVMHADGAGTKSLTAYLYYKEQGDAKHFRGIAQDALVMNIDDLLCVGCTENFVLSNTIGRNAHRVGGEVLKEIVEGYLEVIRKLGDHGISIHFSGGETADVGDIVNTIIVDSTVFCRLRKNRVVDAGRIQPGDLIIGLSSCGQASYEEGYNSGIGSNGLTLARHLLLSGYYAEKYPETFSPTMKRSKAYCGRFRLNDPLAGTKLTVGEALLSPTRTYAPVIHKVLDAAFPAVHGIIHCSGGGQVKCRSFGNGLHYIKDNMFPVPPLFAAIGEEGKIAPKEMHQVFNMGHRMEVYCDKDAADQVLAIAGGFGIEARVVGRVERNRDSTSANRVTIAAASGTLEY